MASTIHRFSPWDTVLDLIRGPATRPEAKADGAKILALCVQWGEVGPALLSLSGITEWT